MFVWTSRISRAVKSDVWFYIVNVVLYILLFRKKLTVGLAKSKVNILLWCMLFCPLLYQLQSFLLKKLKVHRNVSIVTTFERMNERTNELDFCIYINCKSIRYIVWNPFEKNVNVHQQRLLTFVSFHNKSFYIFIFIHHFWQPTKKINK